MTKPKRDPWGSAAAPLTTAPMWVGALTLAIGCHTAARPRSTPRPRPPPVMLEPRDDFEPSRAVPLEVAPVDPEAETLLRANVNAPSVPLEVGEAPAVTLAALEATARGEARGVELDGSPRVVRLTEGQRGSTAIPVSDGDCVTVIVHGGLGVMEVDAFLVAPKVRGGEIGEGFTVLTQDTRTGPLAILGGQRGCFLVSAATPTPVELWVQARKGAGPLVIGIYRAPRPS